MQRHYKPNVVYELLIHGVYHYAGCHCVLRNYLCSSGIINSSGNYLSEAIKYKLITHQEYKECVELVNVWEFNTKEEAQNFEILKIQELKEKYGDLCKNKAPYGNQNGPKGVFRSKETRRKMSEAHKGRCLTEEHRRKIGEANKGKSNYSKDCCWFTNDIINVRRLKCPEGFHPGRIPRRKKS